MGDGVPTDQQSHNHCDCTGGHSSNYIVASCSPQDDDGGYLPQKQFGTEPCVTCQDTPTLPGRAAGDRQERRVPATDRRPDSDCIVLPHLGSTQSECGVPLSMWCCVPFSPMPYHKTIGRATLAMRWTACWATSSSSWTTTMAGPREARFGTLARHMWCVLLLLPLQPGNYIAAAGRKRRRRRDREVVERCRCAHDVHSCFL